MHPHFLIKRPLSNSTLCKTKPLVCARAQTVSCQLGDYRFSEWVRRGVVPLRQALTLERLHSLLCSCVSDFSSSHLPQSLFCNFCLSTELPEKLWQPETLKSLEGRLSVQKSRFCLAQRAEDTEKSYKLLPLTTWTAGPQANNQNANVCGNQSACGVNSLSRGEIHMVFLCFLSASAKMS